jgi:hypothetical protein
MHLEVLVEDQSGKKALEILIPKITGTGHTFNVHAYRGVGRIPKNMRDTQNASNRIFLESLPKLLKGYGKTFHGYPSNYYTAVIVVCDLDDKCLKEFRRQLLEILDACHPQPKTRFCIAIEEGEAWFLGDLNAIKHAYPKANATVLTSYVNDSICGTWEKLADAIYPGGSHVLENRVYQVIGEEKSRWAERISPEMDIENNRSPSFCYFRDKIRELTRTA